MQAGEARPCPGGQGRGGVGASSGHGGAGVPPGRGGAGVPPGRVGVGAPPGRGGEGRRSGRLPRKVSDAALYGFNRSDWTVLSLNTSRAQRYLQGWNLFDNLKWGNVPSSQFFQKKTVDYFGTNNQTNNSLVCHKLPSQPIFRQLV